MLRKFFRSFLATFLFALLMGTAASAAEFIKYVWGNGNITYARPGYGYQSGGGYYSVPCTEAEVPKNIAWRILSYQPPGPGVMEYTTYIGTEHPMASGGVIRRSAEAPIRITESTSSVIQVPPPPPPRPTHAPPTAVAQRQPDKGVEKTDDGEKSIESLDFCRIASEREFRGREGVKSAKLALESHLNEHNVREFDRRKATRLSNAIKGITDASSDRLADLVCSTEVLTETIDEFQSEACTDERSCDVKDLAGDALKASLDYLIDATNNVQATAETYQEQIESQELSSSLGKDLLELAKSIASSPDAQDIAASLTPGVSTAKDFYEAVTGKNAITGEELHAAERAMSLLCVASLGAGTWVKGGVKLAQKLGKSSHAAHGIEQVARTAEKAIESAGEIVKNTPKHNFNQVKDIEAWGHIGQFLGNKKVTDVNPFSGKKDANRIFSQQGDGNWRSLRFGKHEMSKPAGKGMHYHLEEWTAAGEAITPDISVNVLKTKTS